MGWINMPGRRRTAAAAIVIASLAAATPVSAADTSKPSAPGGLTATATNTRVVTLQWTPSRDDVGVVNYIVLRNGTEIGRTTSTSISLADQPASVEMFFQVLAVDAAGNRSVKTAPVVAYVDVTNPIAPSQAYVSQARDLQGHGRGTDMEHHLPGPALFVKVSWTPPVDDRGVTSAIIFRDGVQIAVVPAIGPDGNPSAVLSGQPVGETHSYQVVAVDAAGNRSVKSPPSRRWCFCDVTPPDAPKNVVLTRTSVGVTVSWDPPPIEEMTNYNTLYYGIFVNGVRQRSLKQDMCYSVLCRFNVWKTYQAWDKSYNFTDLDHGIFPPLPSGRLSFQVVAEDLSGNMSVKTAPVYITV